MRKYQALSALKIIGIIVALALIVFFYFSVFRFVGGKIIGKLSGGAEDTSVTDRHDKTSASSDRHRSRDNDDSSKDTAKSPADKPVSTPAPNGNAQGNALADDPAPKSQTPLEISRCYDSIDTLQKLSFYSASASSEVYYAGVTYAATNLIDGNISTSWQEDADDIGVGEYAVLSFNGSETLEYLCIHPGYGTNSDYYAWNSRPKDITISFSDGQSVDLTLEDSNTDMLFRLSKCVTTEYVIITIHSAYSGTKWEDTAISEVTAFYEPKKSSVDNGGSSNNGHALSEYELLAITEGKASHTMDQYVYRDLDHNGQCELVGVYIDNGVTHTWYCSSDGTYCAKINTGLDPGFACDIVLIDHGYETHAAVNSYAETGTGREYSIFAVHNGQVECKVRNNYGNIGISGSGDILLYVDAYDGCYDPDIGWMGHTCKDTYIYYDGSAYCEYGAVGMSGSEFLSYTNAQSLLDDIYGELTSGEPGDVEFLFYKRANGLIYVQYAQYEGSGMVNYGYYMYKYSGTTIDKTSSVYYSGMLRSQFSELPVTY